MIKEEMALYHWLNFLHHPKLFWLDKYFKLKNLSWPENGERD